MYYNFETFTARCAADVIGARQLRGPLYATQVGRLLAGSELNINPLLFTLAERHWNPL